MTTASIAAVVRAHLKKSGLALTSGGIRIGGSLEERAIHDLVELIVDAALAPSPAPEGSGNLRTKTTEIPTETILHLRELSKVV